MGRSTSCFKVMTCASSDDRDGVDDMESKSSADKRRWSFGKRSARHRVLNNTVLTETHSSGNLEIPESNIERRDDSEKIPVKQNTDGKRQLSTLMNSEHHFTTPNDSETKLSTPVEVEHRLSTPLDSKVTDTVIIEKQSEDSVEIIESSVIIIQAAVRGFLDRRKLLKNKNIVKLQAAVRGHLVRQHAAGTLRCVQAIVKMQALARARHGRVSLEGSFTEIKIEDKHENDYDNSKTSDKETSGTKRNKTSYTSVEKLLSNKFARQLMESTPKKKPINFKCDPAKPNSAWTWLERWMSVSSVEPAKSEELITELTENEKPENHDSLLENKDPSEISVQPSESEENMIIYDENNFNFQTSRQISSTGLEQSQLDETIPSDAEEILVKVETLPNETVQPEVTSHEEPEIENEQPKHFMEIEGKKFGSRKSSNPAFIAAQSKFEELSSSANSGKINSPPYQIESNNDTISSGVDSVTVEKDYSLTENPVSHNSVVLVGGSECGTELSVTSTLDSPDIFETRAISETEIKYSEEEKQNPDTKKNEDVEAKDDSSFSVSDQFAKYDDADCESKLVFSKQEELKLDENVDVVQKNLESQNYSLSPEASPSRSHLTVPESQGTPSSEVSSVKPKKKKTSNHRKSGHKLSSLSSAEKRSPSNHHQDSSQVAKDEKNGKRRNSFGSSTKPDNHVADQQESRESDSSVPRFMQATHSARAKINNSTSSPRSSSDAQQHDGEVYVKKRHSLPGANGRQGSPRIQRSLSQEQQGAKGNLMLIL
ncbi:hypothetical protein ACFE04_012364 [Oxalis oulophora]